MSGRGESDQLWAAISDLTRRRLIDVLLSRGEATATELASEVPVSRQAISKHLSILSEAGLVRGRRAGREVRYVLLPARLDEATRAMARLAGEWDQRLTTIKDLAEAAVRADRTRS